MTTLDGDARSPNGTTNLFNVMDDESVAAAAAAAGPGAGGCVRLVHIHKNDDEPMVSVYDGRSAAFSLIARPSICPSRWRRLALKSAHYWDYRTCRIAAGKAQ